MASCPITTAPPSASVLPFPKEGIRLSYLIEFVEHCGGASALAGLTTTEVCQTFVMTTTKIEQSSYCEYLTLQGSSSVGLAEVFISHAWNYLFLDVVEALQYHFRNEGDIVIWFDLFSNNQHKAVDLDFSWWCNTFKSAIRDFRRTVMVMAPWHHPIPLSRGWCLFELFCTAETRSRFEVAMSKAHQELFFKDLREKDVRVAIDDMLSIIDCAKSECFKPEDLDRIFAVVRSTVGFNRINSLVFEQLRGWVVEVTKAAMESEVEEIKHLGLMHSLAGLYSGQGEFDLALPLSLDCLARRTSILGEDHADTLKSTNELAVLYTKQGQYELALPLYDQCLLKRTATLGNDHIDTLKSMNFFSGSS
jgi:hypothetical protein